MGFTSLPSEAACPGVHHAFNISACTSPNARKACPKSTVCDLDQEVSVGVLREPVAGREDGGGVHLLEDGGAGEGGGGRQVVAAVDGGVVPGVGEADGAGGGAGFGEGGAAGGGVEEEARGRWGGGGR